MEFRDGRYVLAQLTVTAPKDDPRGLSTSDLRKIRLGDLLAAVLRRIQELGDWATDPEARHQGRAGTDALVNASEVATKRPRTGRPPVYDDRHFRRVARLYLDLLDRGFSRGILDELARRLDVSRNTARDWVSQARARQFLSPGQPGRAHAHPGPRLDEDRRER
jgi:hypothetical protein